MAHIIILSRLVMIDYPADRWGAVRRGWAVAACQSASGAPCYCNLILDPCQCFIGRVLLRLIAALLRGLKVAGAKIVCLLLWATSSRMALYTLSLIVKNNFKI